MAGLKKKNLELIRAARRGSAGGAKRILAVTAGLVLPAILILAVGGGSLWKLNEARQLQREGDEIEAYINRADIRQACEEAYALSGDINLTDSSLTNMEAALKILNSYPQLDGKTAKLLTGFGSVSIEEVKFENGILKFTAAAEDYREAAPYIEELEESGRFETIVYEGFELTDLYRFRVSCGLRTANGLQDIRKEDKGDS